MWTTPTDAVATPDDYTPGLLSIVVCVSPYAPSYRTQVTMNELPCNPPGSRHTLASRQTALEDHVLRSAGASAAAALPAILPCYTLPRPTARPPGRRRSPPAPSGTQAGTTLPVTGAPRLGDRR